jgi:polysaccharide export outer membrane protein
MREQEKKIRSFKEPELPDYRLKPNDELYIQINSLDEESANLFSYTRPQSVYTGSMGPYGASLLSYTIDREGYLMVPVVGKILAADKTLAEVTLILKDSLNHILNQPIVSVKLVNRYVSVIGEVSSPGHFPYSQDKLSIFDAIGLAGDMTDYANRTKIVLVRNEDGQNTKVNLDLTQADILSSDYYYLRPNDIVYVKPLNKKFWGLRQFPFEVILSAITTGLLIYNVVK